MPDFGRRPIFQTGLLPCHLVNTSGAKFSSPFSRMRRISTPARDRMARPVLALPLTAASLTSEAALSSLRLLAFNEFKQLTAYSSFSCRAHRFDRSLLVQRFRFQHRSQTCYTRTQSLDFGDPHSSRSPQQWLSASSKSR